MLVVKSPTANAGDVRVSSLIPGWGICPGGGHGNPLQYSCLEYPMDRGAWQAIVHGVIESQTRLSDSAHQKVIGVLSGVMVKVREKGKDLGWPGFSLVGTNHFR